MHCWIVECDVTFGLLLLCLMEHIVAKRRHTLNCGMKMVLLLTYQHSLLKTFMKVCSALTLFFSYSFIFFLQWRTDEMATFNGLY